MCQIVVEAEAYSSAPGLLRRGLAELLQHLLATFSTILQEQLPGACPRRPLEKVPACTPLSSLFFLMTIAAHDARTKTFCLHMQDLCDKTFLWHYLLNVRAGASHPS